MIVLNVPDISVIAAELLLEIIPELCLNISEIENCLKQSHYLWSSWSHTIAAKFCQAKLNVGQAEIEISSGCYSRRLDERRESTLSQATFLLAVYWTRGATRAGNTIKHETPKVRKLNPIASPLLRHPAALSPRVNRPGSRLNPSTTFVVTKRTVSFSPKPWNFARLWLPALSRDRVCLRKQGRAKIQQRMLQSTSPRRFFLKWDLPHSARYESAIFLHPFAETFFSVFFRITHVESTLPKKNTVLP